MKFDIAAKLVSAKQRAWVIHAGRSQVNYEDFVSNGVVFLEAPYIQLTKQALSTRTGIRRSIRQAIAQRLHAETTESLLPSQKLTDYDGGVFDDNGLQALSGSISRLYGQAKAGDLVIVPGRDMHDGMLRPIIRIGEITTDFDPEERYSGRRNSTQNVPIRRVQWLQVIPRKNISLYLERKIGKPPAVREIKIEHDTEELLKHAYASYIFEGNSSSLVTADKYDGSEFLLLNRSSDIIAFLVAAHSAFMKSTIYPVKINDLQAFTDEHFKNAQVENIEVKFASPGHWRIVGATVSLAAFVALGITVFSSGLSAEALMNGIEVTNSISPNDSTAQNLEASMNYALRSMDKLTLQKTIDTATNAKEMIGLQSPTKTVK